MAEGLGAPYELALTVNNLRRSFINAADSRENILKDKHSPIKDLVKDKTIWCVDDTVIMVNPHFRVQILSYSLAVEAA